MTTHVHKTTDQPLMNSITIERHRSTYSKDLKGGHREPSVITQGTFDHGNGNFVRPNRVAFKYPNFKKDVDPDAHVKVFNYVVIINEKNSEEYIINAFSYMLRDTTLD
jgi:hypothetical protein